MKGNQQRFYGYHVVFATFIILAMTFGINYSFGVFFKPLLHKFEWSRTSLSGVYSILQFMAGFLGIFAGRISDRFGPRVVVVGIACVLGLGCVLLSFTSWIASFYLIHILLIAPGIGSPWPALMSTIARWFDSRRGLMTGLAASGIGFGTLAAPPLMVRIIDTYGWQTAYRVMGIAAFITIIAASRLLVNSPDKTGERPGEKHDPDLIHNKTDPGELGLKEAVKTRSFALLCLTYIFYGYCLHTVMVHIIPYATDLGITVSRAALIMVVLGAVSMVNRVAIAGISDKVGVRISLNIVLFLMMLSYFCLHASQGIFVFLVFATLFGIAYGGAISLQALIVTEFFGLHSGGVIIGVVIFAYTVGAAAGPVLSGYLFDLTGGYSIAFWVASILAIISFLLSLLLRIPKIH